MLKIFFIFNLLILNINQVYCQNCTYPETPKTGIITYIRLPAGPDSFNFRFFYRMTIDCGMQPVYDDLAISNPMQPDGFRTETAWIRDSSKNVTGVIDPCLVFPSAPCRSTYYYHADVTLPFTPFGLLAASLNCCRPYNTVNLDIASVGNSNSSESLAQGGPPCPLQRHDLVNLSKSPFQLPGPGHRPGWRFHRLSLLRCPFFHHLRK